MKLSSLRPLHDHVLLLRLPNAGGSTIVVPDAFQQPSHRGKVERCGPGKKFEDGTTKPMAVSPGDVVHYQSFDLDDGEFVLIQEGDILGIETA